MKRTFLIPAVLVASLGGLGGAAYAASAFNGLQPALEGAAGYDWSAQRWRDDDRRSDDDRGPRWRRGDDEDRRGPRESRRGDDNCGPGMGRGRGHGEYGWRHHGRGYDRDRGDDRREGRGYGWREGRRFDRDESDRGYRRHGYHHRHEGRDGPRRFGRGFDQDRIDRVKREIGVTAAQEQAWTKYAGTLKEVADARRARRDSIDRSAIARMSTDEFRKFRDGMIDQRRKEQDQVRAAVDGLVGSLDEKQVAVAREVLPGYAFGRMGMGGMGMGGGRNR